MVEMRWEMRARLDDDEPTCFAGKRVFAMLADNHYNDDPIVIWAPAPAG
jgi:hypothetical protein